MHTADVIKGWGHHLHDGLVVMLHETEHLVSSRHFWSGVLVTLLVAGIVALVVTMLVRAPEMPVRPLEDLPLQFPYPYPYR